METIKQLMSKNFGYEVNLNRLKEINLFPFVNFNSFQKFLLEARVLPFLRMILLNKYFEQNFLVAFENTKVCREVLDAEELDVVDIESEDKGSNIIDQVFSGSQLFDNETTILSLQQLKAEPLFFPAYPRIEKKGILSLELEEDCEWAEDEGIMFIATDGSIVIAKEKVYSNDNVEKLLKPYQSYLQSFLNEAANANSIPHEEYIDLLLKWFPGKIKVKSIGYKKK